LKRGFAENGGKKRRSAVELRGKQTRILTTLLRDILPLDPMTYKKQRKENELITKLRIIKLVKKDGYKKAMVARKFMCHRNTVENIVKLFETKIPKEKQVEILSNPSLELEDLKKLLAPIENRSTKPRSNRRSAVMKQVAAIKKIFNEKNVKVGPYRMKTLLRRKYGGTHSERHQVTELERSLAEMKIGCLRGLYKREKLKIKKRRRSANGELRPLYDYRSLACFERFHYDTKEITDSHALPTEIYEKFKLRKSLPVYKLPRPYGRGISLFQTSFALNLFCPVLQYTSLSLPRLSLS